MTDGAIEKALSNAIGKYTEKSRVYVESPDDVPEQYEVQEGPRGGYYYEPDGGDVDNEPVDEAMDTLDDEFDSRTLTEFRDRAMDIGYDLIDEMPDADPQDINEEIRWAAEDMVWDKVDQLEEQGEVPSEALEGDNYDDMMEEVGEITSDIMEVAAVDQEEIHTHGGNVPTEPDPEIY